MSSASCEEVVRSGTVLDCEAENFADNALPHRVEDPGSNAGSATDLK